jgi:hypothetical protein
MHLKKLPTYFVKGDQRKAVYHTVLARELQAAGWKVEGEEQASKPKTVAPAPVAAPEVVEEAPEPIEAVSELAEDVNLDEMTRAELVVFAEKNDIEFKSYASKAEILEACKEFVNG